MADFVRYIYEHKCPPNCTRLGQRYNYFPECPQPGVAHVIQPICVDTGAALAEIERITW